MTGGTIHAAGYPLGQCGDALRAVRAQKWRALWRHYPLTERSAGVPVACHGDRRTGGVRYVGAYGCLTGWRQLPRLFGDDGAAPLSGDRLASVWRPSGERLATVWRAAGERRERRERLASGVSVVSGWRAA